MIHGDDSPRTIGVGRAGIGVIVSLTIAILSLILIICGTAYHSHIEKRSSTAKGTSMTFPVSNEEVTLKQIYTDKKKNVLVARLKVPSGANLPYRGSDYNVYLQSKSLKKYEKADILFGRISTDGDMVLVIPKPTDDIYSVFIENTKNLTSSGSPSGGSSSSSNDDAIDNQSSSESFSKAISNYEYQDDDGKGGTYSVNTGEDAISFRMTTKPAFNQSKYKPKVLNGNLLDKDNKFDFKEFYVEAFKKGIINDLTQRHDDANNIYNQHQSKLDELNDKIKDNPNDNDAIREKSNEQDKIEELENQKKELASQITRYQDKKYEDDLFENMQTEADVIN